MPATAATPDVDTLLSLDLARRFHSLRLDGPTPGYKRAYSALADRLAAVGWVDLPDAGTVWQYRLDPVTGEVCRRRLLPPRSPSSHDRPADPAPRVYRWSPPREGGDR